MSKRKFRRVSPPASFLAALLLIAGCSTASVTPTKVERPTRTYDAVALGQVTADDASTQALLSVFRTGFARQIQAQKGPDRFVDATKEPVPADAVVVSGRILEMSEGSRTARLLIGFGAGSAILRASFEIRDAAGNVLAQFESSKTYAGDLGIGGLDAANMNALASQLGAQTGQAVLRWSKGETLDVPGPAQ